MMKGVLIGALVLTLVAAIYCSADDMEDHDCYENSVRDHFGELLVACDGVDLEDLDDDVSFGRYH